MLDNEKVNAEKSSILISAVFVDRNREHICTDSDVYGKTIDDVTLRCVSASGADLYVQ